MRGPEAKMRDVNNVVEKSNATIQDLRDLAKPLILVSLNRVSHVNRLGDGNHEKIYKLKEDIITLANNIIIEDKEIKELEKEFNNLNA